MEIKIIIGHKRPEFQIWPGYKFATLNPISNLDFEIEDNKQLKESLPDGLIGEYYFLFLLRRKLEKFENLQTVTICQYRRFVTSKPIGIRSENQPYANIITPEDASNLLISNLIEPKKNGWLISSLFEVSQSVTFQYAAHHILRDWLRFLSDSYDAGLINQNEVTEAGLTNLLIPAPSTGVFPAKILIEHLKRLENCAVAFKNTGYIQRDDYQRRVIGFCIERLHSYFLLYSLANLKINFEDVSGQQIVVSESISVKPTI